MYIIVGLLRHLCAHTHVVSKPT